MIQKYRSIETVAESSGELLLFGMFRLLGIAEVLIRSYTQVKLSRTISILGGWERSTCADL